MAKTGGTSDAKRLLGWEKRLKVILYCTCAAIGGWVAWRSISQDAPLACRVCKFQSAGKVWIIHEIIFFLSAATLSDNIPRPPPNDRNNASKSFSKESPYPEPGKPASVFGDTESSSNKWTIFPFGECCRFGTFGKLRRFSKLFFYAFLALVRHWLSWHLFSFDMKSTLFRSVCAGTNFDFFLAGRVS